MNMKNRSNKLRKDRSPDANCGLWMRNSLETMKDLAGKYPSPPPRLIPIYPPRLIIARIWDYVTKKRYSLLFLWIYGFVLLTIFVCSISKKL